MVGGNGGSELGSVEAGADMGRVYRKKEEGEREITYISNGDDMGRVYVWRKKETENIKC